jgi:hypothetical protein
MELIERVPDTTPIYETDDAEEQFPHHELDEMEAEDFGRNCCRVIPCLPTCEVGR